MPDETPSLAQPHVMRTRRLKMAELSSGVGALVLGVGIGAGLSARIGGAGGAIAVIGALLHAFGMWDKHRLESGAESGREWWMTALYWFCWLLLAGGAVALVLRW